MLRHKGILYVFWQNFSGDLKPFNNEMRAYFQDRQVLQSMRGTFWENYFTESLFKEVQAQKSSLHLMPFFPPASHNYHFLRDIA